MASLESVHGRGSLFYVNLMPFLFCGRDFGIAQICINFFLWLAHHCMLATCLLLEYCRAWFSELSFSRISESTTGYTFTPCVGSFTSPGIDTR